MKFWERRSPVAQPPGQAVDRERLIAVEVEKASAAAHAVDDSAVSRLKSQAQLRSSQEVAAALRAHVDENGLAERIVLSMQLREKGSPA